MVDSFLGTGRRSGHFLSGQVYFLQFFHLLLVSLLVQNIIVVQMFIALVPVHR